MRCLVLNGNIRNGSICYVFVITVQVKSDAAFNIHYFIFVLHLKVQYAGKDTSDLEIGWDEHS